MVFVDEKWCNIYFVGIIHPCTHPEDAEAPPTEDDDMYLAIFNYIDRLFSIVRPKKLLYMAIDGVAPRAKMNQQRSRRFRAAKEAEEIAADAERLRKEMIDLGLAPPPRKKPAWDSNVITPGTTFMARLASFLRFYIQKKISMDPRWKYYRYSFRCQCSW